MKKHWKLVVNVRKLVFASIISTPAQNHVGTKTVWNFCFNVKLDKLCDTHMNVNFFSLSGENPHFKYEYPLAMVWKLVTYFLRKSHHVDAKTILFINMYRCINYVYILNICTILMIKSNYIYIYIIVYIRFNLFTKNETTQTTICWKNQEKSNDNKDRNRPLYQIYLWFVIKFV